LTRGKLRWNYSALHPRIYVPNGVEHNLFTRAHAAWLWTGGTGVIAGRAAAAFDGSRWVDEDVPIELLAKHGRRQPGIIVRQERFDSDEVNLVAGLPVTSPARTAFDLARHLPRDLAVPHLDALAAGTGVTRADVAALADRYPGARGIRRARTVVALIDAGAQSPKESWVRLILLDAGLPKPRTQIRISDGYSTAFIDLGWDEPKVGIDYDGDQHRSDRRQFVRDIGRYDMIERQGWIDLRVVAEHSATFIVQRVRDAFARRGYSSSSTPGS
jgi:very-short-patch-repair endonuclease